MTKEEFFSKVVRVRDTTVVGNFSFVHNYIEYSLPVDFSVRKFVTIYYSPVENGPDTLVGELLTDCTWSGLWEVVRRRGLEM